MEKVCLTEFIAFLVLSFCLQVQGSAAKTLVYGCSNYTFHLEPTTKMVNWEKSRLLCKKLEVRSDLVSIESYEEWNILKNTVQNLDAAEYFIGLMKDKHSKRWIWLNNNSPFNASQGKSLWAPGEPNGDGECAVMYKDYNNYSGLYNNLDCKCHDRRGYICERPLECMDNRGTTPGPRGGGEAITHEIGGSDRRTFYRNPHKDKPAIVLRKSSVLKAVTGSSIFQTTPTLTKEPTTDKPVTVLGKSSVKKSNTGSSIFQTLPTTFKKPATLSTKKESVNDVSTKIYKSQPATLPGNTVYTSTPVKATKGSPYFIVLVILIVFLVLFARRDRSNKNERNRLEEPNALLANPENVEHGSDEQENQ